MVTRKIRTVTTKINTLLLDTFVKTTRLGVKQRDKLAFPFLDATSLTDRLFDWDTQVLGNRCSQLFILVSQIRWTVEAI
jgi:hypothetical protein